MSHPRSDKIIAQCELAWPTHKGDCVEFASAVLKHFFSAPDFDGQVLADKIVADLRKSAKWTRTTSIATAIARAKSGDFVLAGLRAAELGSAHGHLAIVAGLDGQPSQSVIVPIGYAGSIGGHPVCRERLSGTFKASLVRAEKVDYFYRVPDIEPGASGLNLLLMQRGAILPVRVDERARPRTRKLTTPASKPAAKTMPSIAFGKRVSPAFKARVVEIAAELGIVADHLMAAMAFETGETFSPSVRNKQSGAVGLIQFMATTAQSLGTTSDALAAMTAEAQLEYVYKYFKPYRGRLANLGDVYMAILWPRGIGLADDAAIFVRDSEKPIDRKRYEQNKGLDGNKDGRVTRHEAAWKVLAKLEKGLKAGQVG